MSATINNLVDRIKYLNSRIQEVITIKEGDDLEGIKNELKLIKDEQEELYRLILEINENLFSSFQSSNTLYQQQSNLASKLSDYNTMLESDIGEIKDKEEEAKRMSKINRYYGDKYEAQSQLIKLAIKMLVPILILAILKNKELIPEDVFRTLLMVVIVIGGIIFIKKYKDVVSRDNMNFQEYDWRFRKDLAPNE